MSEPDRLRRLDALFAERVLGCNVHRNDGNPFCGCPSQVHDESDGQGDSICDLKFYTRSLDAAWEGAVRLGRMFELKFRPDAHVGAVCRFDGTWEQGNSMHHHSTLRWSYTTAATHPAEALVLACLRAKGCTEEELK